MVPNLPYSEALSTQTLNSNESFTYGVSPNSTPRASSGQKVRPWGNRPR